MPTLGRDKTTLLREQNHPFGRIQSPLLGNKTTPFVKTTPFGDKTIPGSFHATKATNDTTQPTKKILKQNTDCTITCAFLPLYHLFYSHTGNENGASTPPPPLPKGVLRAA